MKKTLLSSLLAIFVLSLLVVMTSCNKGGGTNDPTNPVVPGMTAPVSQVIPSSMLPYFDAHNVVVTGTLDTPIMNSSPDFCGGPPDGSGSDGTGNNGGPPPPGGGCPGGNHNPPPPPQGGVGQPIDNHGGFAFMQIMWQLKLTKDQMPIIMKVMWDYQGCVQQVLAQTFAARKQIMYAAGQQQKAIMDALKAALKAAGKDTAAIHAAKKTAMDAMKALNADTQAKLDALIDKTALCACWTKMITDFEAALTTDQLTLFQTWLAKQKTPCDNSTTTTPSKP
jgi:hypothetical protein